LDRPEPSIPDRHQLAEDIRTLVRFSCTPPKATRAYRVLLKQMWRILSTRITVPGDQDWQILLHHMDHLELLAGLKTNAKPKAASAVPAAQPGAEKPVPEEALAGRVGTDPHRWDRDTGGPRELPVPDGAQARASLPLGALLGCKWKELNCASWAVTPVLTAA
jgi:hypothetical protein